MSITYIPSTQTIAILLFALLFSTVSCHTSEDFSSSPAFSPKESLKKMEVEEGFKVELVAAEPLVNTPVAMTFDEKGRIWVVEMESYMLDTIGSGEEKPTGQIIILEDKNKDGAYEDRKVFMDSLILPRAICLIEDGILIAEPPFLWFVEIKNDRPGNKVLVDDRYAIGGNVEHQPNGLLRGLDNWIYNAKSDKRYRKKGEEWIIEETHFRGQWGIAQDDYGRLYYNHNSANVLGDYFPPGLGRGNRNQRKVSGYNENIVSDNRVYPSRPTPGVNRGYMEGILDTTLRLVNFTAAGGPTIYRGDLFGDEYIFNAFVAEPAANLIKRNVLKEQGYTVNGDQAYQDKEFLRSVDERFRPVSLYNGPDGALYIVDMYRGIIQHKTYLTDYLKNQIKLRNLDQPHTYGRIYRVVPKKGKTEITIMPTDEIGLVDLLNNSNGWLRDKAQQILVDKKMVSAAPKLLELLDNDDEPLTQIHSLWTLEGLGILKPENIIPLMNKTDWHIRAQAITAASSIIDKDNYKAFIPPLEALVENADSLTAPHIAFSVQKIRNFDESAGEKILYALAKTYANNTFIADAIISNLEGEEDLFLKKIEGASNNDNTVIKQRLRQVLIDIKKAKDDVNTKKAEQNFPKGAAIFKASCMTCHGKDGYGIESLAPTLNNSDWVLGNNDKLIATVLFGLTGPIVVNGEIPEVTGDMPGIGQNAEFSDEDIAETISFIRNAWSNNASKVSASDIKKIRDQFVDRRGAFTMSEIDSIWKKQN